VAGRICSQCGGPLVPNALTCQWCGTPVARPAPVPARPRFDYDNDDLPEDTGPGSDPGPLMVRGLFVIVLGFAILAVSGLAGSNCSGSSCDPGASTGLAVVGALFIVGGIAMIVYGARHPRAYEGF
jgi:hypothetical protein